MRFYLTFENSLRTIHSRFKLGCELMEIGHGALHHHGMGGVFQGFSEARYHMIPRVDGWIDTSLGGVDVMIALKHGAQKRRIR